MEKLNRDAFAEHGFDLCEEGDLNEISGRFYRMVHAASNARLLLLHNSDPNKSFSITFKTPAADDTGVFHILEHSVLCGSDKFPVKEPFVDLLKGSMQTFLNAMTFPDKTMYPVASTNDRDLLNLIDVYMDAVFNPLIYSKETIFEQEGWHLEVDADNSECKLSYNGVVFNEMKGALSDPDSVLYDTLSSALFPDTTYAFESGGVPDSIVDLTYGAFLDTHKRHYRPDNSYIVLYGDIDVSGVLSFLDEEYLTPLSARERTPLNTNEIGHQTPVISTDVKRIMCTSDENACAAMGYVVGDARDRTRIAATDILIDALFGSNEAPLKRALLDAQLADDCIAYLEDSVAQPFVMVAFKGLRNEGAARIEDVLRRAVSGLLNTGIDHELISASLSHAEFVMREHDMGYADGVVYSMVAMAGWLYGDDMALDYIRYEDVFSQLRAKLDGDYFEKLLEGLMLENDHYAFVEVVPSQDEPYADLRDRLRLMSNQLDASEIERISEAEKMLKEVQSAPDSPEDKAKLPHLSVSQIGQAPKEAGFTVDDGNRGSFAHLVRHDVETHGIVYAFRYFNLDRLSFDDLAYASLLALVLGKLDTESHTAAQIDLLSQSSLGSMAFFCEAHQDIKNGDAIPKFVCTVSALSENAETAATLPDEIMRETNFRQFDRLLDILVQRRIGMEQDFANSGNATAARRAASYYSGVSQIREQFDGIDFYNFLKELIDDFDERKDALAEKLYGICGKIFSDEGCVLSFAGSDCALENYMESHVPIQNPHARDRANLKLPAPVDLHEGFIVPSDVSYTALSLDRNWVCAPYTGSWLVVSRALTYGYLWQQVRVLGGAYGCSFATNVSGLSCFTSYRDPHLDETVSRFKASPRWISEFSPSAEELEGYIVSCVAGMDSPLKPKELIRRQDSMFFSGYTYEERARIRAEVIACTVEDVRDDAKYLKEMCERAKMCVVGARQILESNEAGLKLIELVG